MNWEKFECDDKKCRLVHIRYYDETAEEVVGVVSGPTRFHSYMADYGCETVGEYRTSTAAMQALERHHVQALADREMKRAMQAQLATVLSGAGASSDKLRALAQHGLEAFNKQ